jgi:hypothetical protein
MARAARARCARCASSASCAALALLAALALPPPARATAVYVSALKTCPFKPWSTDSDALFALASTWSHTHDVRNWRFTAEDGNCSRAEYDTSVNVPNILMAYWKKHSMRMAIAKRVCTHGRTMRETATIQNIPFLDSLEIKVFAAAEPETATVSLSAEFALELPWYLKMIDAPVQDQVRNSVREYLEILAGDVCAAPGRRALREAPRGAPPPAA